jgi:DNA-binding NtrC family response regulator
LRKNERKPVDQELLGTRQRARSAARAAIVMSDVLVVDGESGFRRLVRRWVEKQGLEAVEADTAIDALDVAARATPRVVVCDVHLARGQNGWWVASEVQRLYPRTVVIMTTAHHQFDVNRGHLIGVTTFLIKPFSPEQFLTALDVALREHAARCEKETQ